MSLTTKRYITSLNKHSCWLAFFFFHCWFQEKIEISWRNFDLNNRLEIGSKITQMHRIPLLFLVSYCSSASDFLTEDNFFFISNCRNSFNCELKKFIKEQIIFFYSLSHVFCSSGKSVQIDHFKHHTSIVLCSLFTWFYLLILNFCQ